MTLFQYLNTILRRLIEIMNGQAEIKRLIRIGLDQQRESEERLSRRLGRIESLLTPPAVPGEPNPIVTWRLLGERKDINMWLLKYEADLPPVPDTDQNKDVVAQRVATEVDGVAFGESQDVPVATKVVTFEVPKGKTVRLQSTLVDDDGNPGDVSAFSQEFVAKDTIKPGAPGDFGEIRLLGEREVSDPVASEPVGEPAGDAGGVDAGDVGTV